MFFWNSLAFSMMQWMLAIWSLVPLPFLKLAWTMEVHGSFIAEAWLGEFWALLYYRVRWVQFCGSLSILCHCLSLGLEWKLPFSSPVATAEFSKFAGILGDWPCVNHFCCLNFIWRTLCRCCCPVTILQKWKLRNKRLVSC